MTQIDWKSLAQTAEDATKLLPDGTYDVECTKSEATTASTGSKMIKMTLRVADGPSTGRNLWTNLVLSENNGFALKRFFGTLAAWGVPQEFLDQGPSLEMVAAALVGRRAQVVVGTRPWQGEDRNEVKGVLEAAPGTIQPSLPNPGDMLLYQAAQSYGGSYAGADGDIAF